MKRKPSWLRPSLLAIAALPYAYSFATDQLTVGRSSPKAVSYQRDVAPILKAHCFSCHTGAASDANLDLTAFAKVMKGGRSGPSVLPRKAADSLLIRKVKGQLGNRMPLDLPALSAEDTVTLEAWINQGAQTDQKEATVHWAYRKPVRPSVPSMRSPWVRNPIDAFVLERLKKEGLHPSVPASRESLIRRVSLDLTGLPPTPREVGAFVADKNPNAYDKLVDRLLASPQYGERQARGWLDLARYADSDGYEKDLNRSVWKYRDWVIDAFNRNMPYDQFTREQLAGDLLPHPTQAQKIATGFQRNTMFNREGGVNQEEAHFLVVEDRAEVTSSVWLGSTLNCARCHDHKYDPFTQRDYYAMVAFYNNTAIYPQGPKSIGEEKWFESQISCPSDRQIAQLATLKQSVKVTSAALEFRVGQRVPSWIQTHQNVPIWLTATPASVISKNGQTLSVLPDSSVMATGTVPDTDVVNFQLPRVAMAVSGLKLDVLPDSQLPGNGPGRAGNGNFVLRQLRIWANGILVPIASVVADFSQPDFPAEKLPANHADGGWAIQAGNGKAHFLVATLATTIKPNADIRIELDQTSKWAKHLIGRFRVSTTASDDPGSEFLPKELRVALSNPNRSEKKESQIKDYVRDHDPLFATATDDLKTKQAALSALENAIPTALVMKENPNSKPLSEWVRKKGVYQSKADLVTAQTPAVLGKIGTTKANRLDLANWLTRRDNPLTARVEVNRIWEQIFGRGIVETCEDFGTRCTPPTHPELLDWLATEFMDRKWDIKAMQKIIVTSATYMQASQASQVSMERDPQNLYLSHAPRFRMEAEMVRDNALAISGLLNRNVGGPSVYPFQPDGVWDTPYNGEMWMPSTGNDKYRRGIYTFMKRSSPYPSMVSLDATSRETCTVRRIRTNTPLQALALMNDEVMTDASKSLAKKMLNAGPDPRSRIATGFRLCLGRGPKPAELLVMKRLAAKLLADYVAKPKVSKKLAGTPTQAAYTMVANVLLNLDETMTKE